jgi:hypothetical protein
LSYPLFIKPKALRKRGAYFLDSPIFVQRGSSQSCHPGNRNMKRVLFTLIVLLITTVAVAQTKRVKQYLSVSTGFSFPLMKYGSADIQNTEAGWAKPGGQVQLDYTRLLGPRTGITFSLSGWLHPIDTKKVESQFSRTAIKSPVVYFSNSLLIDPAVYTGPGTLYPQWNFKKDNWKMASLLAGIYREFPAKRISWNLRGLLGVAYTASPAIEGNGVSGDTAKVRIEQNAANAWGFGYGLELGLRKPFSKHFSFTAAVNAKGTGRLLFKNITAAMTTMKDTPPVQSVSQTSISGNAKQSLFAVNLQAGLAWEF